MKLIQFFSEELSNPLCNLINSMFISGVYPKIWKRELITPIPKQYPAPTVNKLRPISGIFCFAKIADKILANFMIRDMAKNRDIAQFGNEKGLSTNHYLINMIHKIVLSLDRVTNSKKMAVILNMIDWSQAFERQSQF